MSDGTVVDTDKASASWEEGFNAEATGDQWNHQKLYKTRVGRYYIEYSPEMRGRKPYAERVSQLEAAHWLMYNKRELPEDLLRLLDESYE